MNENLRIGVPSKGRLSELAGELLHEAGINFRRQERTLFARVSGLPIDIIFLRTDDIPVLCAEGAIDLGITGSDLVSESEADIAVRMHLGVGRCRLSLCVPESSPIKDCSQLDGAPSCHQFSTRHRIVFGSAQSQGTPGQFVWFGRDHDRLGVADAIVDLVETGSTLAANQLRILTDIGSYETVLIQNPRTRHAATCDRVVRRLEGVVIARDYSLLEYNVPKDRLTEAEAVTPGFKSPTVSQLEDPNWCAVRAMVRSKDIISVMEQLEAIGASAILETSIRNCRL